MKNDAPNVPVNCNRSVKIFSVWHCMMFDTLKPSSFQGVCQDKRTLTHIVDPHHTGDHIDAEWYLPRHKLQEIP